jgi:flavodoxin I
MNILLVFATYSSGTQVVSEMITDLLKKQGHEVTLKQVEETAETDLSAPSLVIFGSPSWDIGGEGGNPHEHFLSFIEKSTIPLPGKKFAIFGLWDTAYPIFCGAVDHLEEFVKKLQGTLIVPSLRIDGYFFNTEDANRQIEEWVSQVQKALTNGTTPSNP